jgi:hypothetical protein
MGRHIAQGQGDRALLCLTARRHERPCGGNADCERLQCKGSQGWLERMVSSQISRREEVTDIYYVVIFLCSIQSKFSYGQYDVLPVAETVAFSPQARGFYQK